MYVPHKVTRLRKNRNRFRQGSKVPELALQLAAPFIFRPFVGDPIHTNSSILHRVLSRNLWYGVVLDPRSIERKA